MTTLIILILLLPLLTYTLPMDFGLKWGEKCKIPGPNDYLKPSEECEMSKGLHCQSYQQGPLCGCLIRSSLSWDEKAGECRRKPGHHCPYINTTLSSSESRAYNHVPYNHKCHENADCTLVAPIPEIETVEQKTARKKPTAPPQQFAVCRCKHGYKESRDGLLCHNVNSSEHQQISLKMQTLLLLVLLYPTLVSRSL